MKKTLVAVAILFAANVSHADTQDRGDVCESMASSYARDLNQLTLGSILETGEDVRVVTTARSGRRSNHPSYRIEVRNRTRGQTGVYDVDMTRTSDRSCELDSILLVEVK